MNSGHNNWTFFGARPTEGVFQVTGMDELDVDIYAGTYSCLMGTKQNAGELRVFAMGYIDHRTLVLKTDNRSQPLRAADHGKIEVATYGMDYAHVYNADQAGRFDFLVWGAVQNGSWGNLAQHAGAFVGEPGWELPVMLKPWISAGYSYGGGDGDPHNGRHSTFFQLLPTPRPYALSLLQHDEQRRRVRDAELASRSKLSLRSEVHALRLASASDLWYLGGGAFQPKTFGYTGRPSNGNRGLGNVWDLSADYQVTRSFSTTVYYAHAWGKGVIAAIYPKDANGQFVYLETNFHF